jgi:hypothetical protein
MQNPDHGPDGVEDFVRRGGKLPSVSAITSIFIDIEESEVKNGGFTQV